MANEFCAQLSAASAQPGAGGAPAGGLGDPYGNIKVGVGIGQGLGYPALQSSSGYFVFRVPEAVTLATGLTYSLTVADDVNNPSVGKVAFFDVTIGPITSGTTTLDDTALTASTANTVSLTMPATSGKLLIASVTQAVANMNGLAAGNWALLRVRRLGLNAADTHRGRVVLLGVQVRNT